MFNMNRERVAAIYFYKYTGKYLVQYSSPAGKYSIACDSLSMEEKAFLNDARKRGAVYDCLNLAIYA